MKELKQEILRLKEQLTLKDNQIIIQRNELILQSNELTLLNDQLVQNKKELQHKDEQILLLQRAMYGRRSEKQLPTYDDARRSLFDGLEGDDALEEEKQISLTIIKEISVKAEQRRERSKKGSDKVSKVSNHKLPDNLERVEVIIEPDDLDLSIMVKIGEDVTERLMFQPARFYVKRIIRPIYKIKGNKDDLNTAIIQAKTQLNILPGSMADSSLLSQLVVDKFQHHLPEYRQRERFKSMGVNLSTSNINRWIHSLSDKLYNLYKLQVRDVLSSDYIQVDETTISIADTKNKVRKGYLWAVRDVRKPGVFFHYDKGSRSQEVVLKLLKDYKGALQTDGYAAYSIYEGKRGVLPLGCMAHVRCKFENALKNHPKAQIALDYIAVLYMLESNLKENNADKETIRYDREKKAYPILQEMERWMVSTYDTLTPKDQLAQAIKYAFGMWPRICRYCKEGDFEIDNNGVERVIRPIAIGRKNYLFAGNDRGAEDNCIYYTFIASCKESAVDPLEWFNKVLPLINDDMTEVELMKLMPKYFKS